MTHRAPLESADFDNVLAKFQHKQQDASDQADKALSVFGGALPPSITAATSSPVYRARQDTPVSVMTGDALTSPRQLHSWSSPPKSNGSQAGNVDYLNLVDDPKPKRRRPTSKPQPHFIDLNTSSPTREDTQVARSSSGTKRKRSPSFVTRKQPRMDSDTELPTLPRLGNQQPVKKLVKRHSFDTMIQVVVDGSAKRETAIKAKRLATASKVRKTHQISVEPPAIPPRRGSLEAPDHRRSVLQESPRYDTDTPRRLEQVETNKVKRKSREASSIISNVVVDIPSFDTLEPSSSSDESKVIEITSSPAIKDVTTLPKKSKLKAKARTRAPKDRIKVTKTVEVSISDAEANRLAQKFYEQPDMLASPRKNSKLCPFCDRPLPNKMPTLLSKSMMHLIAKYASGKSATFSNKNHVEVPLLERAALCNAHVQLTTEVPRGVKAGYPGPDKINFDGIPSRVAGFVQKLEDIAKGNPRSNFFQDTVEEQASKVGVNHSTVQFASFEKEIPGYYGSKGFEVIYQFLTSHFTLSNGRLQTALIRPLDSQQFIRRVLVPEAGVQLIMQDRSTDEADARQILIDSRLYGMAVHNIDEEDD